MDEAMSAISFEPLNTAKLPEVIKDEAVKTEIQQVSKPVQIPLPRDPLLDFFAAALVRHGRRARAQTLVTRTLLNIHTLTRAEALPILREAILMASPAVKILNHKSKAGKPEPKPFALNDRQRAKYAFRWILKETAKRKGPLPERLAREIIDIIRAAKDSNGVLKLKADLHKAAMVTRGSLR
ncbi:ribosomal protein S7 domain-containing protein [Cyathus striatus]|nr:ribosomal protein S7 domain-containing protein [Cyathus striatus]